MVLGDEFGNGKKYFMYLVTKREQVAILTSDKIDFKSKLPLETMKITIQ